MSDLTEFLLARVAEDEAVARKAADDQGPTWAADGEEFVYPDPPPGNSYVAVGAWEGGIGPAAPHIARWDPARVLAECAAKRAIVALHTGRIETVEWFDAPTTGEAEVCPSCRPAEPTEWNPPVGQAGVRPDNFVASYTLVPCPTLRALALPYAEHADYRPEWRP